MKRMPMTWISLTFLLFFTLPAFADEASSNVPSDLDAQTAQHETQPQPNDPPSEPEDSPLELPEDVFVPDPVFTLSCEEDCPGGGTIDCSCPGTGTCTSGGGGSQPLWLECLCNSGPDDEDQCPFTPPECIPLMSICRPAFSCTCDGTCGGGTCVNGKCNCEI